MSVHPLPRRMTPVPPIEPYYQPETSAGPKIPLRPMTALDQMYAYWGADRF